MERNVKQMLKLIEEGGDSFAQKAEMYYQKRPELISLVEEFYRGYKSLVERIEHNNTPFDVLSQASCVSDNGSEHSSYMPSPRKMGRRISTNRAAGFDVFLGSGGNVHGFGACQKDGDGSYTLTESDEDYDDASSINSLTGFFGSGNDHNGTDRRVMELEIEIPEGKENNNGEDVRAKINACEQELKNVNEKLRLSEGENAKLRIELEKYMKMESENLKGGGDELCSIGEGTRMGGEALEMKKLEEELRLTKQKLESSDMQIVSLKFGATKSFETIQQLQEQLDLAEKDIASWKNKLNTQKRESSKLHERLAKMRATLTERDREVRDLKASLSDVEQKLFFQRANMKSEMAKLLEGQTLCGEKKKEWECQCHLQEEIGKVHSEKVEAGGRIDMLKEDTEERKKSTEGVNVRFEALKLERDNLDAEIASLKGVINSRDDEIEEAHKQVLELTSRAKKLEEEIERQRAAILEGAEEKREAIRQLCFSLEHYRTGYKLLRQAFAGHKRISLLAN
ncbi:hypothetical protein Fmac_014301 [Flemingia macrophylla]|uniref:NAB domain-containing protein n=1 Tax=Flemingia macrophylla TaxID=520843 RepID=A0ABD1MBB4_9FABA